MKKNIDQMTADLYNATKAAYLREFSGIIRNNAKCQPVTVDMMALLANGCSVDGITMAVGTDRKKVIELMPGYSCGLASLPHIYKQVARMAGEPCKKITVGSAALNAYGLTDEQLKAKENKKILAALKKFCPAPRKNDCREMHPFKMGVYHDKNRRCAVWTDAHILIVAPWLYNDAVAGQIVAADGTRITDDEGQPVKYPNWTIAVPDMSHKTAKKKNFEVYSVNAATVAANAASVAAAVKGVKDAKEYFVAARYASDGRIVSFAHAFAPWFSLVDGELYFKNYFTAAVGYIHDAATTGFIVFMPMMLEGGTPEEEQKEISRYADNKTIYADTENDIYIKNQLPQAAADSLPLPFLAVCPEVSTPAEPAAAAAAEPAAAAAAEVSETPAADVAAEPVAAEPVADAAAEEVEMPAEPAADADPAPAPKSETKYLTIDDVLNGLLQYHSIYIIYLFDPANKRTATFKYTMDDLGDIREVYEYNKSEFYICNINDDISRIKKGIETDRILEIKPAADAYQTPAPAASRNAAAEVVEAPAEPAADAAAEPDPDAIGEIVTIPANQKSTLADADILAQAARIKAIYDDLQAEADSQPAGMSCDDLEDNTPIYTAADVEKMIEAATADTYTADEVAAMVAAAVAEERARHTRRRFAPRLRPVLRRLGRVAAVVLPLLIVALFIGASTSSTPAADAAAVTTCQAAAEPVAQVVELQAVTVTAAALTTAPAAPSPVKKLATPSPVKKAAADAVTLPNQKTASALATATAPAADDADSLTTAPAANGLQPTPPDGLTICADTAWAYTMMNLA